MLEASTKRTIGGWYRKQAAAVDAAPIILVTTSSSVLESLVAGGCRRAGDMAQPTAVLGRKLMSGRRIVQNMCLEVVE